MRLVRRSGCANKTLGTEGVRFVWATLEMQWRSTTVCARTYRVRTHVRTPSQNFTRAAVRQPFTRGCHLPLGRGNVRSCALLL